MGRKLLVLALVIFATSTQIVAEDSDDDDAKEEMEIYKIALEFVDECGSKEFSLCIKVSINFFLECQFLFLTKSHSSSNITIFENRSQFKILYHLLNFKFNN